MVPACNRRASAHLILDAVRICTCEDHSERLDAVADRMHAIGRRPALRVIEVNGEPEFHLGSESPAIDLIDIAAL
jgi:hypothetical protein